MSGDEFVVSFHARLEKISTMEMNKQLKGHLQMRRTRLSDHDRNIVIESAGGNHSLQALSTSLQNAYGFEGLRSCSMTNSTAGHRRRSQGSSQQLCRP